MPLKKINTAMRYYEIVGEDVFHGSPFKFDKFSTANINTGEGNQSFGWGLYFAGDAEVANHYRERLSTSEETGNGTSAILDGKVISDRTPSDQLTAEERAALALVDANMWLPRAIDETEYGIEMLITDPRTRRPKPNYEEMPAYKMDMETLHALKTIDFKGRVKRYAGTFYHAEIPDSADYLYWDANISRQSPHVQQALKDLGIDLQDRSGAVLMNKGRTAYQLLAQKLGSPKAASLALLSKGIPGIKYKNGTTRHMDDDDASYNYVIFDDSAVSVKGSRDF